MRGHAPRRRFGQNFLVDPHYAQKIVDAVAPRPGDNIVEIGPGLAALTAALVQLAGRITAIEIDRDLAARLRSDYAVDRLTLHVADALEFDYAMLGCDLRVVGNLPYNISTPLLFRLFEFENRLRDLHIMLQREVIARMTALPATPDYGRLSVMVQARFAVTRLFTVPPGAFRPVPQVESAVARLAPLGSSKPAIDDPALFARIVAAAFGQRRKTLRNALQAVGDDAALAHTGIDPQRRGETLSVSEFAALANALSRHRR